MNTEASVLEEVPVTTSDASVPADAFVSPGKLPFAFATGFRVVVDPDAA